jgi:hypothetical protein
MRRITVLLAVLAFVVAAAVPCAQAAPAPAPAPPALGPADQFDVVAHHVRYERRLFGWEENPGFTYWKKAGVASLCRERIWIAEVWRPRADQIRSVVFACAGQQGTRYTWSAEANIVTGQSAAWRGDKADRRRTVPIRRKSVAGLVYEDGVSDEGRRYGFTPADTLFVLVFDAAFYYSLSSDNKRKAEDGYYAYLLDRIGPQPENVRTLVTLGSSRGGALACRLAKRFRQASSPVRDARVLVGTLDAVANRDQGECGITSGTVTNPLNGDYLAYKAALSSYLGDPSPGQLGMYQVIGGAKVVFVQFFNVARAFINDGAPTFDYSFSWVDRSHKDIGRPWHDDCSGAVLGWLAGERAR